MSSHPFFSIVIPVLNEQESLPKLLTCIKNQTDKDFEVVIADSGSTDKTKEEALKFSKILPGFHFLEHKCRNVSMARNYGAAHSKGEFLVFFDADVEFAYNLLEEAENYIIKFNLDALTFWNRSRGNYLPGKITLYLMNFFMSLFQKIKPSANGPCMFIKKSYFEKIGGFDETIVFGEDFDLIQRIHRQGANFSVFKRPDFYVSTRRFEKEGFFLSLYKSLKAIIHQLFIGPIRKPLFEYEMGGQYYKKK